MAWIKSNNSKKAKSVDPELLSRTSWVDAATAYRQIKKGKATGKTYSLLLRQRVQKHLYKLGCFQQRHHYKVVILGVLLLSLLTTGLQTAVVDSDISSLWVEEGGRLSEELKYTNSILGEGHGSSNQIVVQTPTEESHSPKNVLTRESLLQHLDAVSTASRTEVHLFDKIWRLEDICFKATYPTFENGVVEMMLEKLLPCLIISPLDCFWEGSKLLGPRVPLVLPTNFGIDPLTWKNLNPESLISTLESTINFRLDAIKDTLRRAGINSGYQKKPCINPFDPECPVRAPNYRKAASENSLAHFLTDGCSGFSTEYMHWHEDMILGGVVKNRSNVLVSAEAVQTVIQLMGQQELYNYHKGSFAVSSMDWTEEKAAQILEVFQKKFTKAIIQQNQQSNITDSISSFTQASLDELVSSFTEVSYFRIGIGCALLLLYTTLTHMDICNAVQSHAGAGIVGVLLISLGVASGLSCCALLRLPFNAATTQIAPFLALGLGVGDIFLMVYNFAEISSIKHIEYKFHSVETLKRAGCSTLLTSIVKCGSFAIAAIIPVPSLRDFSIQVTILLLFNLMVTILIFPAVLSCDASRKSKYQIDVVCCMKAAGNSKVGDTSVAMESVVQLPPSPPPLYENLNQSGETNVEGIPCPPRYSEIDSNVDITTYNSSSTQNLTSRKKGFRCDKKLLAKWYSPGWFVRNAIVPLIHKTWFKVIVGAVCLLLVCLAIYGVTKVKDGMNLTEIVPHGTNEHTFLEAQSKHFGFYEMYIVTKGDFRYELSENQILLRQLHEEISNLDHVIGAGDATASQFWLDLMVQWLRDLQRSFDRGVAAGAFHADGWHMNATDDAELAYKLLIQTGDIDNPIDKARVKYKRLVNDDGSVPSDTFYNYLTAWIYNDLFAYDISQATIRPEGIEWYFVPRDLDVLIPRAPTIKFARMPFYLHNLGSTEQIIQKIGEIRDICDKYVDKGLPNYPSGVIFTYWEQYLHIRFYLVVSLVAALCSAFIISALFLMNPLAALLGTLALTITVVELFGFMGLIGIKLSAISAVILITSVGIAVGFFIHIIIGFLTAVGDKSKRISTSLHHMFSPVLHGAISTILGIIILFSSNFDFIVKYFCYCLIFLVLVGGVNGLIVLPILLSICGPNGELQPKDPDTFSIDLPTPNSSPPSSPIAKVRRPKRARTHRRVASEASLSTISEESTQMSSQEVIVEPRVNVSTTVAPVSDSLHEMDTEQDHTVTRVRTKATVTVEVHAELPNSSSNWYRNSCRQDRTTCHCPDNSDNITSV